MSQENKIIKQKEEGRLDEIVNKLFGMLTNTSNRKPNIRRFKDLFLKNGILINNSSGESEVYNLESIIKLREEILTNGILNDFKKEEEIFHRTDKYWTKKVFIKKNKL